MIATIQPNSFANSSLLSHWWAEKQEISEEVPVLKRSKMNHPQLVCHEISLEESPDDLFPPAPLIPMSLAIDFSKIELEDDESQRRRKFIALCNKNINFFETTVVFDGYLISHAFNLLCRANISSSELNMDLIFSALWLSCATEEDSPEGIDEIMSFHIGNYIDNFDREYVAVRCRNLFEDELEYQRYVAEFHKIKDDLWRRMGHNTLVREEDCTKVMSELKENEIFQRIRTHKDLELFAPF
jgi:hypothetical protein